MIWWNKFIFFKAPPHQRKQFRKPPSLLWFCFWGPPSTPWPIINERSLRSIKIAYNILKLNILKITLLLRRFWGLCDSCGIAIKRAFFFKTTVEQCLTTVYHDPYYNQLRVFINSLEKHFYKIQNKTKSSTQCTENVDKLPMSWNCLPTLWRFVSSITVWYFFFISPRKRSTFSSEKGPFS